MAKKWVKKWVHFWTPFWGHFWGHFWTKNWSIFGPKMGQKMVKNGDPKSPILGSPHCNWVSRNWSKSGQKMGPKMGSKIGPKMDPFLDPFFGQKMTHFWPKNGSKNGQKVCQILTFCDKMSSFWRPREVRDTPGNHFLDPILEFCRGTPRIDA